MNLSWKPLAAIAAACLLSSTSARDAEPGTTVPDAGFERTVKPFFATYCDRCHDAKTQEGKFRLDTLPRDFTDEASAQRWGEVLFRMNSGEMPPKDEPQPKPAELGHTATWISARLHEGEAARMAKRGPVAHYRLSRDEYANTVYDLLGIQYDVNLPGAFNEDPRWHGFERVGSMLSLSPSHVDRYFKAAEEVLGRAFPEVSIKPNKFRRDPTERLEKTIADRGITKPVRWPVWPGGRRNLISLSKPGTYRVRIQLSGMQPAGGRTPHLSLWHHQLKRSVYDQDIVAPEEKPMLLDFEMELSPGSYDLVNEVAGAFNETGNHTLNVLNGGGSIFTTSRDSSTINPTGYKLFDDAGLPIYPMLLVDFVELEGPLTSDEDRRKRDGLVPWKEDAKELTAVKESDLAEARACLKKLAERAWRRPVSDDEVGRYVKIVESEVAAGEKFRSAYRAAMIGVLTSKNFYYLEEGSATERRATVTDTELASRLSYFLWGSMPDDELTAAARSGSLHDPKTLQAQLTRMLADPKVARFSDAFPRQWLQLHRVGTFPPDPKLYPEYDRWLERSMVLESTHYFGEVFAKNLPLREFLSSDWTMVNPRLASFYDLPPLAASGFQRVALRPEDHRGGILTHASVLSLTSDGTRHRPVHRGVWVSEAIFGRTPPPPPPNVEPLEPTPVDKPKATIRMQLEAHATHAICASCHRNIDPLGFAFDNFDAIGSWRTEEKIAAGKGSNPPVNASGLLPDGRSFAGPEEFKQHLLQDVDRFAEAFVEQLATFALRRVMTIDDAAEIRAIAQAAKRDDYRLRTVVEEFVKSNLFRKR